MNLEGEIHAINKKLNDVAMEISLLKQFDEFEKADKAKLNKSVDDLIVSVNRLNLILGNRDGFDNGKSTVIKWVYTIFGGLITLWLIWITSTSISNASEISNLKNKTNFQKGNKSGIDYE